MSLLLIFSKFKNVRFTFLSISILIFGFTLSILICIFFISTENAKQQAAFNNAAKTYQGLIQQGFSQDIFLVKSLQAFFLANYNYELLQFDEFATRIRSDYQGTQVLAWSPRITSEKLPAFKAEASKYLTMFEVTEEQEGNLVPVKQRSDYFPAYNVEPFQGNSKVVGFDLGSNAMQATAIEEARSTGNITVTSRVTLRQTSPVTYGFFAFAPVIREINQDKVLEGIASGFFRIDDVIAASVKPANIDNLDFVIYEGSDLNKSTLIASKIGSTLNSEIGEIKDYFFDKHRLEEKGVITVANKKWNIILLPAENAYSLNLSSFITSLFILLLGIAFSIFAFLFASNQVLLDLQKRELEKNVLALEIASNSKSDFLAKMSHELRTPLNAIIGFSEVLAAKLFGDLNSKQLNYVNNIFKSGVHLLDLINDILDLSKLESGFLELNKTEFELATVFKRALDTVGVKAEEKHIHLTHSDINELGQYYADERGLQQILLNLLTNAIKFTPEGGQVSLMATKNDKELKVTISDSGVGISVEDQKIIFDEFRQVEDAQIDRDLGTGLGLTIVKSLVEMHGGQIVVISEVGEGSAFSFTIPNIEIIERVLTEGAPTGRLLDE